MLSMRAKISYLDGNQFDEEIVYELNNGLWEEIEDFNNTSIDNIGSSSFTITNSLSSKKFRFLNLIVLAIKVKNW